MDHARQEPDGDAMKPARGPEDMGVAARVDRGVIAHGTFDDEGTERAYWLTKTPEARQEALELMRQVLHGHDPATE